MPHSLTNSAEGAVDLKIGMLDCVQFSIRSLFRINMLWVSLGFNSPSDLLAEEQGARRGMPSGSEYPKALSSRSFHNIIHSFFDIPIHELLVLVRVANVR